MIFSSSGYNTEARYVTESKKTNNQIPHNPKPWKRQNGYDFTGCLAHVEITLRESNGAVTAIVGHLEHDSKCQSAVLRRLPAVPLHPHVYATAIEQLKAGSRSVNSLEALSAKLIFI